MISEILNDIQDYICDDEIEIPSTQKDSILKLITPYVENIEMRFEVKKMSAIKITENQQENTKIQNLQDEKKMDSSITQEIMISNKSNF